MSDERFLPQRMVHEVTLHVDWPEHGVGAKLDSILALLQQVREQGVTIMSRISDEIASAKAAIVAYLSRHQEEINQKNAEIARLQALVDEGGATAEDEANLQELVDTVNAMDPTNPATLEAFSPRARTAAATVAAPHANPDVNALRAQIAILQALVDSGSATQADRTNMATLKAKLNALDPTAAKRRI